MFKPQISILSQILVINHYYNIFFITPAIVSGYCVKLFRHGPLSQDFYIYYLHSYFIHVLVLFNIHQSESSCLTAISITSVCYLILIRITDGSAPAEIATLTVPTGQQRRQTRYPREVRSLS